MCMVSINIDEAALRDLRPELDTTAAIRLWAQELVDLRMQQMRMEREQNASKRDASQEDLWRAIEQDPELTLKPSLIEAHNGDAVDLETFRADLHKMVEEVYAEA